MVSDLYSTHQSSDLVNDITNCHFFIREIPGTSFNWDTRDVVYAPLYTHTILEKGVGWKLWYCFESLALRYYPENLPHLLKVSTYCTWWHQYFCLCIRRVTEVLKKLFFVADFFNKSDDSEIFLFLLKHAFKTKTFHLSVWKKLTVAMF